MSNSARQRTRFTVTFEDGTKKVILCYNAAEARHYYEHKGYAVAGVMRGDYRKQARVAAIKSQDGHTIDTAALNVAKAELGLIMPVKIRRDGRVGQTNGNHRLRGFEHHIMLKSYLTPEQATHTLWHELTHAVQAERAIASGRGWAAVSNEQRRYRYSVRPIEIEANKIADAMMAEGRRLCR
jgi:hypothetical protein